MTEQWVVEESFSNGMSCHLCGVRLFCAFELFSSVWQPANEGCVLKILLLSVIVSRFYFIFGCLFFFFAAQ